MPTVKVDPPKMPQCCSFCGKPNDQVWLLIAGSIAYICDGCTDLCHEIVVTARAKHAGRVLLDGDVTNQTAKVGLPKPEGPGSS